jgi:hypothetical protein
MAKVSVTYKAPKDDAEVVYMRGVRFVSGTATQLDDEKDAQFLSKLRNNQHFKVAGKEPVVIPAAPVPPVPPVVPPVAGG